MRQRTNSNNLMCLPFCHFISRRAIRTCCYTPQVRRLCGTILELGHGSHLHLTDYGLTARVVAVDISAPSLHAAHQERKLAEQDILRLVCGDGARLPFAANTFDAIVACSVFCCVRDVEPVAAELARVAKRGAPLVLLEHVRSVRPTLALLQDVVTPLYARTHRNCRLNRNPVPALEAHGFTIQAARRFEQLVPWLCLVGHYKL